VANLGADAAGATVHGQIYDSSGVASGGAITSGIAELQVGGNDTGTFIYLATVADGFVGSLLLYDSGDLANCAAVALNPQETENADAKTSDTATQASVDDMPSAGDVVTAMQAVADDFKADVGGLATQASVDALPDVAAIISGITAYAVETGHSLDTVLKAIYAGIRGKAVADDADDPSQVAYYAPDGATVRFTHNISGATRTVS
jgi:hypothetical protein